MSDSTTLTFEPVSAATQPRSRRFPWVNLILFAATVVSTIAAGTLLAWMGFFGHVLPPLVAGVLFSASILLILGSHELGHYFTAHWHGMRATLPYFIPAPLGLGTFGAFIRLRGPTPNRRALFDVGLAGPVAGLIVALPLFFVGLMLSPFYPQPSLYGDGILTGGVITLVETLRGVPDGYHLSAHPVSFAAYVALFITAVNLLPAGQLDGGHIAYAMLGRRSVLLSIATFVVLIVLGLITRWFSWFLWAGLIAIFGLRHPPTLNDEKPLGDLRRIAGAVAFILLVFLFASNPFPFFR